MGGGEPKQRGRGQLSMGLRATSGIEWLQQWGCRDVAATWYGMRFVGGIKKEKESGGKGEGGGRGRLLRSPCAKPPRHSKQQGCDKKGQKIPVL